MKVGKLILHYNTPEMTDELCRMVGPDAIVIDNGSDLDKQPIARQGQSEVVRLEKNYGFTKGWNLGVLAVYDRFDAFWLMNSDIVIDRKTIQRIEKLLSLERISMITPSYNSWMKSCQNLATRNVREVKCIEFTAPVIKKSVFDKIGFFDESFALGYGVEFDFCIRMKRAGFKMFVDDGSKFYHKGQQTIKNETTLQHYSAKAMEELKSGMEVKYGENWRETLTRELNFNLRNIGMKRVALITTIFGGYAKLMNVPEGVELQADLYCITDDPDLETNGQWKIIVPDYPRRDLHPRMRAKFFKMFPWDLPELKNYEAFIYIDGSIEITSGDFVRYCMNNLKKDMVLFKHPQRDCIYEEQIHSSELKKYQNESIADQVEAYRSVYPAHGGLYACGVMAFKNNATVKQFMGAWWWENVKWSYQDQISFPVICKLLNFQPSVFPDNQYKNNLFKIHWHDDNPGVQTDEKLTVDILMPVYKTPVEHVKKAIESIFAQDFEKFKIIIVDDNNPKGELTDYLYNEVAKHTCCVTIVRRKKNEGIAAALDEGLEYCQGDIVLRMDSDDIAHPDWVSRQVAFFENHKCAHICGVQINMFNEHGSRSVSRHPYRVTADYVKNNRIYWITNHPGIGMRRKTLMELGGYGKVPAKMPEDYALWMKFLKAGHIIYNMDSVLIDYRLPPVKENDFQSERPEALRQDRKSKEWYEFLETQRQSLYEQRKLD